MTAKEYLSEIAKIDRRISSKLELRQEYWEKATRATSCLPLSPKKKRSKVSRIEKFAVYIADLDNEINRELDEMLNRRREAKRVIESIPDHRYRDILEMRYLHGTKWKRIMADMHYASASVFRLHGKALQAFDKMRVNNSDVLHIL